MSDPRELQVVLPPVEAVDRLAADALPGFVAQLGALALRAGARLAQESGHAPEGAERAPYTLPEAAGLIHKSTPWLRRRAKARQVPGARQIGRSWVFERDPYDRWRRRPQLG
jgi:hypothetical protein